jgi:hypothetical protein
VAGTTGSVVGAGVVVGGGVVVTAAAGVVGVSVAVAEGEGVNGAVDEGKAVDGVGEDSSDVQPLEAAIIAIIKIMINAEKAFLLTNRWSCVILIFPLTGLNQRRISL